MRLHRNPLLPLLCSVVALDALHFHPLPPVSSPVYFYDDVPGDFNSLTLNNWRNKTGQPLISNATSAYTEELINEWDSTGLALAVVQKDGLANDPAHPGWRIEFGSYGKASTHTQKGRTDRANITTTERKLVTPDTLFAIASNSKLFLSISVGLLIHNKTLAEDFKERRGVELGWKTKMRDLLGEDEWAMWDEDIAKGATIADLLGHRTGMPRHDYSGVQRKGNVKALIQKLRYLRPSATFRETFQYNNLMYETLSYLPELLLNQTYESYIAQHLFEPLNMTSSTFSVADVDAYYSASHSDSTTSRSKGKRARFADRMAHGHLADRRDFTRGKNGTLKAIVPYFTKPGEERTWAGAGGVITTARDLSTWVAMLLNNGRHPYTNTTIVPPEVLSFVTHGRSIITGAPLFPDTSPMVYGAGQFRFSYRGLDVLEHGGNNPGFKSQVARFPQKELGVVSLSNDGERGGFVLEAAKWAVVDDVVFGEREGRVRWSERYHKLWERHQKDRREKVTKRPTHPEAPSRPFEELGRKKFEHPTYGSIALCRVPLSLLRDPYSSSVQSVLAAPSVSMGAAQRPLSPPIDNFLGTDDFGYDNPHANCTELLSSPSTIHILSSRPYAHSSNPPATFIASYPRSFSTHMQLVHFSGNVFNVSVPWANDEVRREVGLSTTTSPSTSRMYSLGSMEGGPIAEGEEREEGEQDEGALVVNLDETFTLEWVAASSEEGQEEGLAIRDGFWGMEGPDASEPKGEEREGAEVWFGVVSA